MPQTAVRVEHIQQVRNAIHAAGVITNKELNSLLGKFMPPYRLRQALNHLEDAGEIVRILPDSPIKPHSWSRPNLQHVGPMSTTPSPSPVPPRLENPSTDTKVRRSEVVSAPDVSLPPGAVLIVRVSDLAATLKILRGAS